MKLPDCPLCDLPDTDAAGRISYFPAWLRNVAREHVSDLADKFCEVLGSKESAAGRYPFSIRPDAASCRRSPSPSCGHSSGCYRTAELARAEADSARLIRAWVEQGQRSVAEVKPADGYPACRTI